MDVRRLRRLICRTNRANLKISLPTFDRWWQFYTLFSTIMHIKFLSWFENFDFSLRFLKYSLEVRLIIELHRQIFLRQNILFFNPIRTAKALEFYNMLLKISKIKISFTILSPQSFTILSFHNTKIHTVCPWITGMNCNRR